MTQKGPFPEKWSCANYVFPNTLHLPLEILPGTKSFRALGTEVQIFPPLLLWQTVKVLLVLGT